MGREKKKTVGKYLVGKVGWEREDMVPADLSNTDELIGAETRHKCVPLQLLTPSFGYGGSCERRHTQAPGAYTHKCEAPLSPPLHYYSDMHVKAKKGEAGVLSRQASFPTA